MRRPLLAFLCIAGLLALLPARAGAQEPSSVRMTLLSQTPWNSSYDPERGRELEIGFRAQNLGASTLSDLSIGVTAYARVISRSAYESSLATDPTVVIDAQTFPRDGSLEPGQAQDFEVALTLDSGIDPDDSGVYPVKVELRSGFTVLGAIRTAAVFLVRPPEVPLDLSWTVVLQHPIAFGPDGVFTSSSLEAALGPGGRLAAEIHSLMGIATDPAGRAVDVAIAPTLLTQLARMQNGYSVGTAGGVREVPKGTGGALLAQQALADLRQIAQAPGVRVLALPFSSPELPSLESEGLGRDVAVQIARGREVVGGLLETTPVASVFRPPGAALDDQSLQGLAGLGVTTIVAGPSTVTPSPQPNGFLGPPTARLEPSGAVAIVPEPGIMAMLESTAAAEDPVLTAQVALAELATIWQEQPGLSRGAAIVLPEDLLMPSSFYGAFLRGVAGAPWLAPMHAGDFAARFAPEGTAVLAAPPPRRFSSTYVAQLRQARRRVETLRSMLVGTSEQPDDDDTMLLLAEARQFLSDPSAGLAFIGSVRESAGAVFDAIRVDSPHQITLTSSTGSGIPVTVTNGSSEPLRMTLLLASQSLRSSPPIDLELGAGDSQTVTFRVDAQRTGRFTADLQLLAPNGRPIDRQKLTVRSTVYNRIALVITMAAAFVLLLLWARRFVPRRTS